MGHKKTESQKTVQPLIDEVTELQQPNKPAAPPQEGPLKPAELDQDPGGGFNRDHTYPQT
jgi:hypothetical protein